jgi:hypothetical protein
MNSNACYVGQAGMHQGILAFNKALLLKLLHDLIFNSPEQIALYGPQSSHTSIQ